MFYYQNVYTRKILFQKNGGCTTSIKWRDRNWRVWSIISLKMKCRSSGPRNIRKDANKLGQRLSMGWGFMIQSSHYKDKKERLSGINRKQRYLLICDNWTQNLWYISPRSKNPPKRWFNIWMTWHFPSAVLNEYTVVDQGR